MNAMRRGHLLRLGFLAGMMVLLMPPNGARAEMWCIRDFGSDKPVCVFATARDCTSAAVIRGGICEREPLVSRIRPSLYYAAPSERRSDTKGH